MTDPDETGQQAGAQTAEFGELVETPPSATAIDAAIDRDSPDPRVRLEQLVLAIGYTQAHVAATCAEGHDLTPPAVLVRALDRVKAAIAELQAQLDEAWSLVTNAGDGDWTKESAKWQAAAARFAKRYAVSQYAPRPADTYTDRLGRALERQDAALEPHDPYARRRDRDPGRPDIREAPPAFSGDLGAAQDAAAEVSEAEAYPREQEDGNA